MYLPLKIIPKKTFSHYVRDLPISCVDIVFFNKTKNKILLFKRKNEPLKGKYFTTGGRIFKNEELIPAVIRKAKEETGTDINPRKLVFGDAMTEIFKNSAFKYINYHAVVLFWGYILNDTKIKLDNQHSKYKWFSIHDKSIHPLVIKRIKVLLKKLNKNEKK